MFTGIIESVGKIKTINAKSGDFEIVIDTADLDLSDVKLGDSIAVSGVCLTVTQIQPQAFCADVSAETIKRTKLSQLNVGSDVNLEKACTPNTRLGGHIVSGHVDGVGHVVNVYANANATDYWIEAPDSLAHYIAEKGSITVDGISLTVNEVQGAQFRLTIIPHTTEKTAIHDWQSGARVNLEVDVIARYLERLMQAHTAPKGGVTLELLKNSGMIK
ncbi:riboflavin synthase [Catenovulum sediminis]|uniref:Riboflavin synthase n=1 Tax=Catenovulum sediminis TaxID=1740262 RepID=A0ABV1RGM1_9ALTE|nr:riboflavin synthase [Catenovulum sediminis]